jgi:hypothetical protein
MAALVVGVMFSVVVVDIGLGFKTIRLEKWLR